MLLDIAKWVIFFYVVGVIGTFAIIMRPEPILWPKRKRLLYGTIGALAWPWWCTIGWLALMLSGWYKIRRVGDR